MVCFRIVVDCIVGEALSRAICDCVNDSVSSEFADWSLRFSDYLLFASTFRRCICACRSDIWSSYFSISASYYCSFALICYIFSVFASRAIFCVSQVSCASSTRRMHSFRSCYIPKYLLSLSSICCSSSIFFCCKSVFDVLRSATSCCSSRTLL